MFPGRPLARLRAVRRGHRLCDLIMDYVQTTEQQRQQMLQTIGVKRVDQLYRSLPEAFWLNELEDLSDVIGPRSELQLQRDLEKLGTKNKPAVMNTCFLGGGCYDHFIPAIVGQLAGQGAFVTAYTPYQAEASQGSLQAFFEFQTQICKLTALDVANASLYEGATAAAEAVMMALNVTGKRRVLIASSVHPHTRAVLCTYTSDLPVELSELALTDGRVSVETIEKALDTDTACVVVQSPNIFGLIEDWSSLFATVQSRGDTQLPLCIAIFNPIACGLLKRPGDCGADIAVAEGQPLGVSMQYGGPWLGLFAARRSLMRRMPGRLIGQTVDRNGRRGFCLTLQTREQHIRGAKATSNICTNQGLLALQATIYLSAMGPQGLHDVAQQCYHKAHYAASQIASIDGYKLSYSSQFFHEFVVDCPVPARAVIEAGRKCGILVGLDCANLHIGTDHQLLIAVTEKRTVAEIDALVGTLAQMSKTAACNCQNAK